MIFLSRSLAYVCARFLEIVGDRGKLVQSGIHFPTFKFSMFVEFIPEVARKCRQGFVEYRATSRSLLFLHPLAQLPVTRSRCRSKEFLLFPLGEFRVPPRSCICERLHTDTRARARACTREERAPISFRGCESCRARRQTVSQYISGMHGAFHDKIFQYWRPVSIYQPAREIRRAVGTYLYEFHFGWLYSLLALRRDRRRGGTPKRGALWRPRLHSDNVS